MNHSAPAPSAAEAEYLLHLYITGATPNSMRAVRNIKEICEAHLAGRYELLIIDIYQQPDLAQQEQIIAAPTLIRVRPLPRRQLVGDLSNRAAVLISLGVPQSGAAN
ncbi:circadian clock KaiB family protein [Hymenobacter bucti]|uniref:Circadian clock KaiB family protein n=1 Tax=Hymenobacter bucti TaxID=1844114 RepID=A0ABW4QYD7_9BACT